MRSLQRCDALRVYPRTFAQDGRWNCAHSLAAGKCSSQEWSTVGHCSALFLEKIARKTMVDVTAATEFAVTVTDVV